MTPPTKARAPRLRASCDGCFLAKVKCSKSRPMCSRCLASGIICHYSPSSRAGKSRPESNRSPHMPPAHNTQPMRVPPDDNAAPYLPQTSRGQFYHIERTWGMPHTSGDGSMAGHPSLANNMPLFAFDQRESSQLDSIPTAAQAFFPPRLSWDPTVSVPGTAFPDPSSTGIQMPFPHSQSMEGSMNIWSDQEPSDIVLFPQAQTSPNANVNYLPTPHTTPTVQPTLYSHPSSSPCACFGACLQTFLDLHNSTQNSAPLEMILDLSDKAVDGCLTMMACETCLSRSGSETSAMLLVTIFAKIASSLKTATHLNYGYDVVGMSQSILNGSMSSERHLVSRGEQQIRSQQLDFAARKLQEAFSRFRSGYSPTNMARCMDDIARSIDSSLELIQLFPRNNDTSLLDTATWEHMIQEDV